MIDKGFGVSGFMASGLGFRVPSKGPFKGSIRV